MQKEVICKISAQYDNACRRKVRKTSVTDGRTDRQTEGPTECKPIVPPGFTGGGTKNYHVVSVDLVKIIGEIMNASHLGTVKWN